MFSNGSDLLSAFLNKIHPDFYDPIILTDVPVGFSIKRHFPDQCSFIPTVKRDGTPNNVVLIYVVLHIKSQKNGLIPLSLRISNWNIYLSNHFDYNISDPDSPDQNSISASAQSRKPISLDSLNEFFFDTATGQFITNSLAIEPYDILTGMYTKFCNTVHPIKGWALRTKIMVQNYLHNRLGDIIDVLRFILHRVFGRAIQGSDGMSELLHGHQKGSLKRLSQDNLEIFGFKISIGVAVLFCALTGISALYGYNHPESYVWKISDKEVHVIGHAIFAIWVLDYVFPYSIFIFINWLIAFRAFVLKMKFNI